MTYIPPGPSESPVRDNEKAALRGEPSYVWRAGQDRRLKLILEAAGKRLDGPMLENGCGVGMYLEQLAFRAWKAIGLEYDLERAQEAGRRTQGQINASVICAAGEKLPFPDLSFDLILSHEVLEHVQDDRLAVQEMVRILKPSGRIVLFVPNRGYPFETHGVYWRGEYRFGNIPLVNYLPARLRNRLAPHVRAYRAGDVKALFRGLPVRIVQKTVIFGAYDNIIARSPRYGRMLRAMLQLLEKTPLNYFGLSHFWVLEKGP
jgi:SAM-dependent methyltransferase